MQFVFISVCMRACSVVPFTCNSATLWTVARQAPQSMGFSQQEYRNGLPCPPPGIEPVSLASPALQADSLPPSYRGSPYIYFNFFLIVLHSFNYLYVLPPLLKFLMQIEKTKSFLITTQIFKQCRRTWKRKLKPPVFAALRGNIRIRMWMYFLPVTFLCGCLYFQGGCLSVSWLLFYSESRHLLESL